MIVQIAGLVSLDGAPPDRATVSRMLRVLDPQGTGRGRTERAGRACFGAVGIGGDGAGERLPIAAGHGLFVADAVLWDRAAVAATGAAGDAEAVRRAVLWKGAAVCADLHGDFAWAWWDGAALTLARDHFGVRPLVCTVRPGRWIAFASHPDALIETGLARPALDAASALNFTAHNSPLPGRHYQADISVVRPAHLVEVTLDGRARTRRYWRLPTGPLIDRRTTPGEVAEECRRLLEQAVRRRLPAHGPVAGHLSGGIDSSAIAAIAARAVRPAGRTFHGYSFEDSETDLGFRFVDEAPYVAEIAAAEPNIAVTTVSAPGFTEPMLGPHVLSLLYPFNDLYPEKRVLDHAAAQGVDRIFSGWGGDQIVSYAVYEAVGEMVLHGRWAAALAALRSQRASLPVALYYRVLLALLPERLRRAVEGLTGRGYPPLFRLEHFRPAGLSDPPLFDYPLPPRGRTFLSRREMVERNWIQHRLGLFAMMGAPWGIRYVHPLLDLDLVAFAMRVPGYLLLRDGANRRLLRDAIAGLVPESVRLREAKLFPQSLEAIRFPRLKGRFAARLARIRPGGLAASMVDVEALAAALEDRVETPEQALERLREHAERGEQFYLEGFDLIRPLGLAIALDEYEARWGRAAWPDARA